MPRSGWRRRWIKLYPQDCLDGSIRYKGKRGAELILNQPTLFEEEQ